MDLAALARSALPLLTTVAADICGVPASVVDVREGLQSLQRWCARRGVETTALRDEHLAKWVAATRSSSGSTLRLTLVALTAAYGERGMHCPVGERTQQAVARRMLSDGKPARQRRKSSRKQPHHARVTHRVSA